MYLKVQASKSRTARRPPDSNERSRVSSTTGKDIKARRHRSTAQGQVALKHTDFSGINLPTTIAKEIIPIDFLRIISHHPTHEE